MVYCNIQRCGLGVSDMLQNMQSKIKMINFNAQMN